MDSQLPHRRWQEASAKPPLVAKSSLLVDLFYPCTHTIIRVSLMAYLHSDKTFIYIIYPLLSLAILIVRIYFIVYYPQGLKNCEIVKKEFCATS